MSQSEPFFVALGVYGSYFYFRRTDTGAVIRFTARSISRKHAVLALVPSYAHWQSIATLPATVSRARLPDWNKIGAMLIQTCLDAGPYRPSPEDMPPRNPRGADKVPRIRRTRAQIEADRAAEDAAYEAAKNIK